MSLCDVVQNLNLLVTQNKKILDENNTIKSKLDNVLKVNMKIVKFNINLKKDIISLNNENKEISRLNQKLIKDTISMQKINNDSIRLNISLQKKNNKLCELINTTLNIKNKKYSKKTALSKITMTCCDDGRIGDYTNIDINESSSDSSSSEDIDLDDEDIDLDDGKIKDTLKSCVIKTSKVSKFSCNSLDTNILMDKLDIILKNIEILKKSKVYLDDFDMKELKKENIKVDISFARRMLEFHDHRSIIYIMREYYKSDKNNKIIYPIKYKQNHGFDYFSKGRWIHDTYGEVMIDILFVSFKALFMRCNDYSVISNMSKFIENQTFIQKFNDNKFKRNFARYLKNEIISNV